MPQNPALHGNDAGRAVAADQTHALPRSDGHVGRLSNNPGLAVIETHRDLKTLGLSDLVLDCIAGHGAQYAAAYGGQYIARAAAYRAACHAPPRTAAPKPRPAPSLFLAGAVTHGTPRAAANTLPPF